MRKVSSGRIAASLVEWHLEGEDQASQITVKDGHTIFWRSAIDKRVKSTEQAPGIAQDTPGRTDLNLATLLDRHRPTDLLRHTRFNAHAVGAQIVGEVFGGHV
jgi:hypothetical protein